MTTRAVATTPSRVGTPCENARTRRAPGITGPRRPMTSETRVDQQRRGRTATGSAGRRSDSMVGLLPDHRGVTSALRETSRGTWQVVVPRG